MAVKVAWRRDRRRRPGGFSLVELLLALGLGLVLSGVMLQSLLADGQTSLRLSGTSKNQQVT